MNIELLGNIITAGIASIILLCLLVMLIEFIKNNVRIFLSFLLPTLLTILEFRYLDRMDEGDAIVIVVSVAFSVLMFLRFIGKFADEYLCDQNTISPREKYNHTKKGTFKRMVDRSGIRTKDNLGRNAYIDEDNMEITDEAGYHRHNIKEVHSWGVVDDEDHIHMRDYGDWDDD